MAQGGASRTRKWIPPGDRITVMLSRRERELVLKDTCLGGEVADRLRVGGVERNSVAAQLTLDELDDIVGYVAAAANHAEGPKMQKELDRLYDRLARIQDSHDDEELG